MVTAIKILLIFFVIFAAIEFSYAAAIQQTAIYVKEYVYPAWMIVLLVIFGIGFFGLLIGGLITWYMKIWCFANKRKESASMTSKNEIPDVFRIPDVIAIESNRNNNVKEEKPKEDTTNQKAIQLPVKREQNSLSERMKMMSIISDKDEDGGGKAKKEADEEKVKKEEDEKAKKEDEERAKKAAKKDDNFVPLKDVLTTEEKSKESSKRKPSKKGKKEERYEDAYGKKEASPYQVVQIGDLANKVEVEKPKPQKLYPDAHGKQTSPYELNTLEGSGKK